MPFIASAPNLTDAITESIRYHQKNLGTPHHGDYGTDRETAGQMATAGGATVEVMALVKFEKKHRYGQDAEHLVQVGASARCHGWGCAEPERKESFGDPVPLDANVYDTAASVEPLVQTAREWAQAHAEKCRATPYTGR